MGSNKDYFDYILQQKVREEYNDAPEPPLTQEETWDRIQKGIRAKDSQPRFRFMPFKRFAISLIICLIIIVGFAYSGTIYSFGWISQYMVLVRENVTQIVGNINPAPNSLERPKINEVQSITTTEDMSLTRASNIANFDILIPSDLSGYHLENVKVWYSDDNQTSNKIELFYVGESGRSFSIKEEYYQGSMGFSTIVDNEDTIVEEISINGYEGSYLSFKDQEKRLVMLYPNIRVTIKGQLDKGDLIGIAESLVQYEE